MKYMLKERRLFALSNIVDLERERDFYYGKLLGIEELIQKHDGEEENTMDSALLKEIQAILYATEEGFEAPQVDENGDVLEEEFQVEDAETF
jgi:RP/EB family microtubule-associated protein